MRSLSPNHQEVVWEGKEATELEVRGAVEAARTAFPGWSSRSLESRIEVLHAFRQAVESRKEVLAETISREMGKPLWESQSEIASVAAKIEISIQSYHERTPLREERLNDLILHTRHRPHGALAILSPFNFPAHLPTGHMVPALLAGNTIILKPSEETPAIAELLVQCWEEAGLCNGEVNLVQGGVDTGKAVTTHPQIDGLLFTGSAQTGHLLAQQFAHHPEKILALEMGGNNPLVVNQSSDLPAAAYTILMSAYLTSGQRCTCARRLIAVRNESNRALIQMLLHMMSDLQIGHSLDDPQPFLGPLVSRKAAQRVLKAQEQLIECGAQPLKKAALQEVNGALLSPGLLDVTEMEPRAEEEIFGPLLQLQWVHSFDEALEEANRTQYGLASGLISDEPNDWNLFLQKVHSGIANFNTPTTGASSTAPFGGLGASGNHRPAGYYAADYCAYPVASYERRVVSLPQSLAPGVHV